MTNEQRFPRVRVHELQEGDWFACCTEVVWLVNESRMSQGCNWYGETLSKQGAENDAARHRRFHRKQGVR